MKFLHISDLHYLIDYEGKGGRYNKVIRRMEDPFKQLAGLLDGYEGNFDFVIVSGDICEYGEVEDYLAVRKKLEEIFNCPVLTGSGNHDNRDKLMTAFDKVSEKGELFEEYRFNDLRVIMFDSSDPDHNDGLISETTCDLLQEALKDKSVPAILVTHHHLLADQFVMDRAEYPERLRKIIREGNVVAVLTGHTHHIYHGEFEGKQYHTTGSLSFVGESDDKKLSFYQYPSALVFEYEDGVLKYQELLSKKRINDLDCWDL